ncbi:MAG TPA: hypothetical protein VKU36_01685 [Candidatus Babeliales bacterium]|nr:hypothetical protein [Candidatus Babeliales bacterium]
MNRNYVFFSLLMLIGFTTTDQAFWGRTKLQEQDVINAADNCFSYDKTATEKLINQIKEDIEDENNPRRMWALLQVAEERAKLNYVKLSSKAYYEIMEKNGFQPTWFSWENYRGLIKHVGEDKVKEIKTYQDACNCKEFSEQFRKYNEERIEALNKKAKL